MCYAMQFSERILKPGSPSNNSQLIWSCDFDSEEDSCEFNVGKDVSGRFNVLSWRTGNVNDAVWLGGPRTGGGYVMFETSSFLSTANENRDKTRAWLISPQFEATDAEGSCLNFDVSTKYSTTQLVYVLKYMRNSRVCSARLFILFTSGVFLPIVVLVLHSLMPLHENE